MKNQSKKLKLKFKFFFFSKKVAEEMSKYIFEDPSIYTYDDHYD